MKLPFRPKIRLQVPVYLLKENPAGEGIDSIFGRYRHLLIGWSIITMPADFHFEQLNNKILKLHRSEAGFIISLPDIQRFFNLLAEAYQFRRERKLDRVAALKEQIAVLEKEIAVLQAVAEAQKVKFVQATLADVLKYDPKARKLVEIINKHRLWLLFLLIIVFVMMAGTISQAILLLMATVSILWWIGMKWGKPAETA